MESTIKSNIWKIYVGTFLNELMFLAAIVVPFLSSLGLSMQQILITESIFAITIFILEIPSGYFADRIGRKPSLILGTIGWMIGMAFYAFAGDFLLICLGALFWGIGTSFNSGANEAMLYESLQHLNREHEYKKVQGNVFFYGRIGAVIGGLCAGLMASINIMIPVYATFLSCIPLFFISLTLKETRHEIEEKETWNHFKRIFRESFLHNKQLRYFMLFTSVSGFFTIEFWLAQKYWGVLNVPFFYFGLIVAGMSICSAFVGKYGKEIEEFIGEKFSLIIIPLIAFVVWIIFASISAFWVIPLFFITTGLRGFTVPIFNDFIQKHSTSDRRATIMSVKMLLNRMVFLICAPFLGWITDVYSVQMAFLVMAGILFGFSMIMFIFMRKVRVL